MPAAMYNAHRAGHPSRTARQASAEAEHAPACASEAAQAQRTCRRGLLVVVSGPSGAGKTTICRALQSRLPEAVWSVSATTRSPRVGEVHGRDYYFVSRDEFERMVQAGELLEWAEYVGNLYGTPAEPVRRHVADGKVVLMEIDVQGGRQIAEKVPDSVRIFLLPPSDEELARRLKGRKTESPEQQQRRLELARREIALAKQWGCYQHYVINDTVDRAVEQIFRIIETERSRT